MSIIRSDIQLSGKFIEISEAETGKKQGGWINIWFAFVGKTTNELDKLNFAVSYRKLAKDAVDLEKNSFLSDNKTKIEKTTAKCSLYQIVVRFS